MDAYQSLSNRVASMEELLRRSESTMTLVLQRLKTLEEYVSTSELRQKGEGAFSARLDAAVESQNTKLDALQGAFLRQASAAQVIEERMQGAIKALEQRLGGDILGCHQRMQTTESSLLTSLRNAESALQSQGSSLKFVEQSLRNNLSCMEQHVNSELMSARQRIDALDSAFKTALADLQKSLLGEMKTLSDTLFAGLQSSIQSAEAGLLRLDQQMQANVRSVYESVARDVAAIQQSLCTHDTATRDALQGLHSTLAGDIKNVCSQLQMYKEAHQLEHQQVFSDLASQRQLAETVNSTLRAELNDLKGKVQESWQIVRAQQGDADLSTQQKFSHMSMRIDDVYAELGRIVESHTHKLRVRVDALDSLRNDWIVNNKLLETLKEEHSRLRGEFQGFSSIAERSAMQLRLLMENAVRASHSDLLERLKPLTAYRTEMHAAIAVAMKKLWSDACTVFTSQRDVNIIQQQIEVLDRALRSEVTLLAEQGRYLQRSSGERQSADVIAEGPVATGAAVAGKAGGLVTLQEPAVGELNNMWNELRDLQKRLGMPKEEVISAIRGSRQDIIDSALEAIKRNESEFRNVLSQIECGVRKLTPIICEGSAKRKSIKDKTDNSSSRDAKENSNNNSTSAGTGSKKKTVLRLRLAENIKAACSDESRTILRINKNSTVPQLPLIASVVGVPISKKTGLSEGDTQPSVAFSEADQQLPPLAHSAQP